MSRLWLCLMVSPCRAIGDFQVDWWSMIRMGSKKTTKQLSDAMERPWHR